MLYTYIRMYIYICMPKYELFQVHFFAATILLLLEVGFNLLIDRTGRLLKQKKAVTRKDILSNPRVPC